MSLPYVVTRVSITTVVTIIAQTMIIAMMIFVLK